MVLSSIFELLERVEHLPDVIVALHHLVAVLPDARLAGELLGREIRRVPHRERQVEEERLARGLLLLDECDGTVG